MPITATWAGASTSCSATTATRASSRTPPTARPARSTFTMKDDGYDAARAIPNVDELLDSEKDFAVGTLGSSPTLKTYDKVNQRCVPQPFVMTAHPAWGDPVNHPWTTGAPQLTYSDGRAALGILHRAAPRRVSCRPEGEGRLVGAEQRLRQVLRRLLPGCAAVLSGAEGPHRLLQRDDRAVSADGQRSDDHHGREVARLLDLDAGGRTVHPDRDRSGPGRVEEHSQVPVPPVRDAPGAPSSARTSWAATARPPTAGWS